MYLFNIVLKFYAEIELLIFMKILICVLLNTR